MKILEFKEWKTKVMKGEKIIVDCPECNGDDYYCLCCNGYGEIDMTYHVYMKDRARVERLLERWVTSANQ